MTRRNLDFRPGLLSLAIATVLAACGGGGDDPSAQDGAVAQLPADGASAGAEAPAAPAEGADAGAQQVELAEGEAPAAASTVPEDYAPVLSLRPDARQFDDGTAAAAEAAAAAELAAARAAATEPAPVDDVPLPTEDSQAATVPDPAAAEREQPLAVLYAKPRIAAVDYSNDTSDARAAYLSRFNYVILGLSKSKGPEKLNAFTRSIKARHGNIKIAQYVIHNEVPCSASSSSDAYDLYRAVSATDWWLRNRYGSRMQWTGDYGTCDINITAWGKRDSSGRTWAQYKWQRDWNAYFRHMPAVDHVHIDNTMWRYRKDADFRRNGTNQPYDESTYEAAWRKGMVAYATQIRNQQPHLKISVNADRDLSQSEYKDKFDLAFLEGVVGRSWSLENWGWDRAMNYYRGAIRNTRSGGSAIFVAFTSPTNYKLMRYSLASAMMENGYFMQVNSTGAQKTSWFDEFNARIGLPIEAPPTRARQNGIWMRKYQNGLVLVNPSKVYTRSIYVGSGYRRLRGTQDPTVNNGAWQSTVTLPPRSGLLMLRG